MASTINVLTAGIGGIQQTGDTSGILQMQTNGTATLTIDTSGNVGIGTASPAYKLDVYKAGAASISAARSDTQSTVRAEVGSCAVDLNTLGTVGELRTATNSALVLSTNSTERMRIGTLGEIGLSGANYGTSGQFLKSNGPGAAATWGTAGGGFSNMTVFTAPGTFTTPSTTTQIKVTVVGGGGNGGPAANGPNYGGSGGGGGGAAIYVGPVTASTGYAVTVGTAGNTSSFGVLASATGGSNGSQNGVSSNVAGAAGGAGSAGTLQIAGGGGGGSTYGVGGGTGGNSLFGGGGFGTGAAYSAQNGGAGRNYGGGGGGGAAQGAAGAGAAGVVIVEY